MKGKAGVVRNDRRKEGGREEEEHQRKGRVGRSAIKRIKCSLCSRETYGAPANSKSDVESIEMCAAKGGEKYSKFFGRLSQIFK